MTDDLVQRLRDGHVCSIAQNSCRNGYAISLAADRIEALTAENKRLREALQETRWVWERHKYNGEFTHFLEQHICAACDDVAQAIRQAGQPWLRTYDAHLKGEGE